MAKQPTVGKRDDLISRGDIFMVSLDPSAGHEQKGRRPVLVVSPASFNRVTRTAWVVPITSGGEFARTIGFAVALKGHALQTTGIVRCDQVRALDMASRQATRVETVPEDVMQEVLARIQAVIG